eukprot:Rmarinus@m.24975
MIERLWLSMAPILWGGATGIALAMMGRGPPSLSCSTTRFSKTFYKIIGMKKKWDGPKQYVDAKEETMMLPADMAFKTDPIFRKYVEVFAIDEELFFKEFSAAFSKLLELGCSWCS